MDFFDMRKYQPVKPRFRLSSIGGSILVFSRNELMSGTNVIDTSSAASSEQLITTGKLYRNLPVSPGSNRKGRYEAMFVIVANAMTLKSLVGPAQAAMGLGLPSPSSRTMASPDT